MASPQVNKQVIKPDERALMSRLVDIMAALELRFVQEKSEDGQLMYRLDPWVSIPSCAAARLLTCRLQANRCLRDIRGETGCGHRGIKIRAQALGSL